MMSTVESLLKKAVALGASDLHLTVGAPPVVRVAGELKPVPGTGRLDHEAVQAALGAVLAGERLEQFLRTGDADFSIGLSGVGRFRVNAFSQRGSPALCFRVISSKVRSFDELGLPPQLKELCRLESGLVLVTGPSGCGKSTTLAAFVDFINEERAAVVIAIEDPVEYLHKHKRSIVNQREVGTDTVSFAAGLRAALREDPDVIIVGEMRDRETMETALRAAETGHLVISTLHTRGAAGAVDRIVDSFPPDQQQVRVQLAGALRAVVWQQLVPAVGGGVVAACEVMIATPAVRNLIREGRTAQIDAAIETGARYGMQSMELALERLMLAGKISREVYEDHLRLSGSARPLRV